MEKITKKEIEKKIELLKEVLKDDNINLDYNSNYSNKYAICFNGANRWDSTRRLYFSSAKECYNFIKGFINLYLWEKELKDFYKK